MSADNSHLIQRMAERYDLNIHNDECKSLADFIRERYESNATNTVILLENRDNGFLFYVNLFRYYRTSEYENKLVFMICDKDFNPKTVLPNSNKNLLLLERAKKRLKKGKKISIETESVYQDRYLESLRLKLKEYYECIFDDILINQFFNAEYVRQNVLMLPSKPGQPRIGRLMIQNKEVVVVINNRGVIDNVLPYGVIKNYGTKIQAQKSQQKMNMLAEAIKKNHVSFC